MQFAILHHGHGYSTRRRATLVDDDIAAFDRNLPWQRLVQANTGGKVFPFGIERYHAGHIDGGGAVDAADDLQWVIDLCR